MLAFNHILKTGGTSFCHALESSYSRFNRIDWICQQLNPSQSQIIHILSTSDCIAFHTTDRIFRTIALPLIIPLILNQKLFIITILRNPIERIESLWRQQWNSDFLLGSFCSPDRQPKDCFESLDDYLWHILEQGHEFIPQTLQFFCYLKEPYNEKDLFNSADNHYLAIGTLPYLEDFFYTLQMLNIIKPELYIPRKNTSITQDKINSTRLREILTEQLEFETYFYEYYHRQKFWINEEILNQM